MLDSSKIQINRLPLKFNMPYFNRTYQPSHKISNKKWKRYAEHKFKNSGIFIWIQDSILRRNRIIKEESNEKLESAILFPTRCYFGTAPDDTRFIILKNHSSRVSMSSYDTSKSLTFGMIDAAFNAAFIDFLAEYNMDK